MIPDKLIDDLERIGVYVIDVFDDYVEVSAENTDHLSYYGVPDLSYDPYISRTLQRVIDDYDCYLEWYNAGIAHIALDY